MVLLVISLSSLLAALIGFANGCMRLVAALIELANTIITFFNQ